MRQAKNYFAWQARLVKREIGRRVVEVGCGIGNFTELLLDRDLVLALDVEPRCVELLRARFPGQNNLHAFIGDGASTTLGNLAHFRPDSCVCINVLEHIDRDGDALKGMSSVLMPGGVVVLFVPAFQSLYGPIDRNLGHHHRYNRTSILRLAEAAGLGVEKIRYVNTMGFFGWWVNAHVLRRVTQSEAQIRFFDRYVVPILSPLEEWITPPFGQSLFAVLRKR